MINKQKPAMLQAGQSIHPHTLSPLLVSLLLLPISLLPITRVKRIMNERDGGPKTFLQRVNRIRFTFFL